MSDLRKAAQAMHDAAKQYDVSVVAIVLEDEEEAIVVASNTKNLLSAQELIEVLVEKIPEELLEESKYNNGNPKENHYLNLLNDCFPVLYQTLPGDIKESFIELYQGKSVEYQEKHFKKTLGLLKVMNKIISQQ